MNDTYELKTIARVRNDLREKFGIPRQSGLVPELLSAVVFEEPYRNPDALRGIEGFSHLWLLWAFSESVRDKWSPTVRPPRLGGNERVGVFATRSPFRPNPIGLSCVGLVRVERTKTEGDVLIVSGADLMDGTPVFDIKPYIAYADARPDALCGFVADVPWRRQPPLPYALRRQGYRLHRLGRHAARRRGESRHLTSRGVLYKIFFCEQNRAGRPDCPGAVIIQAHA